MIKKYIFCTCNFLLCLLTVNAQFAENFTDGDITSGPVWQGNSSDWMVNSSFQLQSNNTIANSSFFLSTISTLATTAQWEFYVNMAFNPSSANYIDVYLTASASDLTAGSTSGYFVRIGNTNDEISLYRKPAGAAAIMIIDGVNSILNTSNNTMKIKVVRNAAGQWTLLRDLSGTGNLYSSEGNVVDNTYLTSAYFGFLIKQSTVTGFAKKHFIDDIEAKPYVPDTTAPVIQSAIATSATAVDVLFNEPLDNTSSQLITNYIADNSLGNPSSAVLDAMNSSLVHLSFTTNIPNGVNCRLVINGVQDLSGNTGTNGSVFFSFYTAQQYDVVIDEIMADPSPVVSLPNVEWIELQNTSVFPINLKDWRIGDESGTSGPMPAFILKPDSFVLISAAGSAASLSLYGATISVTSFPSLDNNGEQLFILSNNGRVIHSVLYSSSWYKNELKKEGGWSLEMIDKKTPCTAYDNWKASEDPTGGTPGKINSVNSINADDGPPKLLRAYALDSLHITLVFDEPLDSMRASAVNSYTISDGIGTPANVIVVPPAFERVVLELTTPLLRNKIYSITASLLKDCVGNMIGPNNIAKLGLSETCDSLDIVINEILFNPPPGGTDYVEIYNRSNKIIDLKQLYIANKNNSGSFVRLSTENYLLFPGDFMVITEDRALVKSTFITQNPEAFAEVSVPSFNDDKGTVLILNSQGKIIDSLTYSENWHFKLIDNREGVALERIDYEAPTQLENNWHSAATSAGYGTPTYKNSQYRVNDDLQGNVNLSPGIISPDNDGQDDFATVDYSFPVPGYVANITIFDAVGRPMRYLQRNALCGIKGNFRWDGLGDKGQQLATGMYIVFTEIFNLEGKKKHFKNVIVLVNRR